MTWWQMAPAWRFVRGRYSRCRGCGGRRATDGMTVWCAGTCEF